MFECRSKSVSDLLTNELILVTHHGKWCGLWESECYFVTWANKFLTDVIVPQAKRDGGKKKKSVTLVLLQLKSLLSKDGFQSAKVNQTYFISCMLSLSSTTWISAGMEASVKELFLSSRFFRVLLALIAAHKSLIQASVKPVISTLQWRPNPDLNECPVVMWLNGTISSFVMSTYSSSSNKQLGCATASQRCLTPWSPTLLIPTIRDLSWQVPFFSSEPSSLKTATVNSHRAKLQSWAENTPMKWIIEVGGMLSPERQKTVNSADLLEQFYGAARLTQSLTEKQRPLLAQIIQCQIQLWQREVFGHNGLL